MLIEEKLANNFSKLNVDRPIDDVKVVSQEYSVEELT
jgi:hypothetical protein